MYSKYFLYALLFFAVAMGGFAQVAQPDFLLPDGGCHYVVVQDTLTGERTMMPASQARRRGHYASTADGLGAYGTSGVGPVNTIGDITIPVIMVDFSDQGFLPGTTEAAVEAWFNGQNYTSYGNTGSVRDYFVTQSGGMFRPNFKVMGIVHTGKTVATYGAGGSNQENVEGLAHAVTGKFGYDGMTRQSGLINYVPLCVIYYAGGGQHRTGRDEQIWAKFTEYSYYDFAGLFSQYFKSYLYINEARGNEMDGVGTACHEISHALGLPDVYDTSGSGCRTPGLWSVMASGNYAGSGCSPVDMCALERSQCGWLQIKELSSAGSYKLAPTEAALIRNASNSKEYYILENRTGTRWTPPGMSGGMLVYHVDYDKTAWENSKVNVDNSHPRMMFVAADRDQNDAYESDYRNDLYPYQKNDSLTVHSNPAMTAFSGNFNGKPIYNIRRGGSDIYFDFIVKTEQPEVVPPVEREIVEVKHPKRSLGTPIASLSEAKSDQLYALYNPHFTSYAIYAPQESKAYVWTAETRGDDAHRVSKASYSKAFDVTSSFSAWRVIGQGNRYAFQNEGCEFYLSTPMASGSNPCAWVTDSSTMMTQDLGNGLFCMTSSGATLDYFCVAPQLTTSPISVWNSSDDGAAWQLIPIYDEEQPEPVVPNPGEGYVLGTPVTSLDALMETSEYALYCPYYKGYAIMDESHSSTRVWTAELTGDDSHVLNASGGFDGPYDMSNPYHRWSFSPTSDGKWLIQNVGTQTYIRTAGVVNGGSGATTVSSLAEGVTITPTPDGCFVINRTGHENDFMCAAPQLDFPVSNWSASDPGSRWQVIPVEYAGVPTSLTPIPERQSAAETNCYDLQGRAARPMRGIYISNRRKILR